MAHALAPHFGLCDLNPTFVAHYAFVSDPFVLTAIALPVVHGPEDTLAKESVTLGFERSVVQSFGLLYLAVRPLTDLLR